MPVSKRIVSKPADPLSEQAKELEDLKKQIAKLNKLVNSTINAKSTVEVKPESKILIDGEDDETDTIRISPDDYIKVMSVCPNQLNLSTEEKGRGRHFTFENFGEVKRILYSDLVKIMETNPSFLSKGYYVVLNKNVVRKHGLDEIYKNILTKEKIEQILTGNQSDAANLYKSANESQQEIIDTMIIQKIIKGENVDLNLVDRLERISGHRILERAENSKKNLEIYSEKEE